MRAIVLLGLALVTGCGEPAAVDNRPIFVSDEIARDFADHPERYAGKTLTAKVCCLDALARLSHAGILAPSPLRGWAGRPVDFAFSSGTAQVDFKAILPTDPAKMPERLDSNSGAAVITFLCTEGKLDSGNRILQMLAD